MDCVNPILDIEKWIAPGLGDSLKKEHPKSTSSKISKWVNNGAISPLDLYCYLKARFGTPNGVLMLSRTPSSDNIIQWHYTLISFDKSIEVIGTNSWLEINVKDVKMTDDDWGQLILLIKKDYANYGALMGEIRNSLEKWTIFINPYRRLDDIVNSLSERLQQINIEEPKRPYQFINKRYARRYVEGRKKWLDNLSEAKTLGASIRMLAPVLAESFVNLIIFLLAKEEVKQDERLYQDLIRKQIDVRVKSLHLFCEHFTEKISGEEEQIRNFLALMNSRNDFLHGNVDPLKFKSQEVFFDGTIPLFKDEQSLQSRFGNDSIRFIEPEEALRDFQTVKKFVDCILQHIASDARQQVVILMGDSQPGWRQDTGKVGNLFPAWLPEFLPIKN